MYLRFFKFLYFVLDESVWPYIIKDYLLQLLTWYNSIVKNSSGFREVEWFSSRSNRNGMSFKYKFKSFGEMIKQLPYTFIVIEKFCSFVITLNRTVDYSHELISHVM